MINGVKGIKWIDPVTQERMVHTILYLWITWDTRSNSEQNTFYPKALQKQRCTIPLKENTYKMDNTRENECFIRATLMIKGLDHDKCQHPMPWDRLK